MAVLIGGSVLALGVTFAVRLIERRRGAPGRNERPLPVEERETWRMPPLETLAPAQLTLLSRTWLIVLRSYLVIAAGLVLVRIAQLVAAGH